MSFIKPSRKGGTGFRFGFFSEDADGKELEFNTAKEYYEHIKKSAIEDFKKGFGDTAKSEIEFQDLEDGVRVIGEKEAFKQIQMVNVEALSPYEYGIAMADAYLRSNDDDPTERNTFYEEDEKTGRSQKFDKERLIQWIVSKKLTKDYSEWRELTTLNYEDRLKKLDSIAYLVARKIFNGGY